MDDIFKAIANLLKPRNVLVLALLFATIYLVLTERIGPSILTGAFTGLIPSIMRSDD